MITAALLALVALFLGEPAIRTEKLGQFIVATTNFVSWTGERQFGPLNVAVFNDPDLDKSLHQKKNLRTSKGRRIDVQAFDWEQVNSYHIILVGKINETNRKKLAKAALENQIVIIAGELWPDAPSIFVNADDARVRYSVNETAFQAAKIGLNASFLRISGTVPAGSAEKQPK